MRIKLIEPSQYLPNGELLKVKKILIPSLALPYIASLTPDDIDVSIVSERVEDIDFNEDTDLVGITATTIQIFRAYEIADEFRKRGVPVVMGGVHVSMEPEEALAHADTVIIGEAEELWPEFLNDFQNGIKKEIYKSEHFPSLENLPIPRFPSFNQKRFAALQMTQPVVPIQTARGCPHHCEFCAVTRFTGGKYRVRPVTDVVEEIKAHGTKKFFFMDDNIFAIPSRARELFRALIPLKIRWAGQGTIGAAQDRELIRLAYQSGCVSLVIGIESLSAESLKSVGKSFNKVEKYEEYLRVYKDEGISPLVSMVFGFDDEEETVFKQSYDFLMKNRLPYTLWWVLRPYPGTPLLKKLAEQGRLKDKQWWLDPVSSHRFLYLRFSGIKMDEDVFYKNFNHYYRMFYSWKKILLRIFFPLQRRFPLKILFNLLMRKRLKMMGFIQPKFSK